MYVAPLRSPRALVAVPWLTVGLVAAQLITYLVAGGIDLDGLAELCARGEAVGRQLDRLVAAAEPGWIAEQLAAFAALGRGEQLDTPRPAFLRQAFEEAWEDGSVPLEGIETAARREGLRSERDRLQAELARLDAEQERLRQEVAKVDADWARQLEAFGEMRGSWDEEAETYREDYWERRRAAETIEEMRTADQEYRDWRRHHLDQRRLDYSSLASSLRFTRQSAGDAVERIQAVEEEKLAVHERLGPVGDRIRLVERLDGWEASQAELGRQVARNPSAQWGVSRGRVVGPGLLTHALLTPSGGDLAVTATVLWVAGSALEGIVGTSMLGALLLVAAPLGALAHEWTVKVPLVPHVGAAGIALAVAAALAALRGLQGCRLVVPLGPLALVGNAPACSAILVFGVIHFRDWLTRTGSLADVGLGAMGSLAAVGIGMSAGLVWRLAGLDRAVTGHRAPEEAPAESAALPGRPAAPAPASSDRRFAQPAPPGDRARELYEMAKEESAAGAPHRAVELYEAVWRDCRDHPLAPRSGLMAARLRLERGLAPPQAVRLLRELVAEAPPEFAAAARELLESADMPEAR